MVRTSLRIAAAFTLAASALAFAGPAAADNGDAFATQVVPAATLALRNAMQSHETIGQVPPVSQQPVGRPAQPGLPVGLTYQLDFSSAWAYGNIGNANSGLPGGMDGLLGYGFSGKGFASNLRFVASYYELQHQPYGFNSGQVPIYLHGFANPIGCVDLSGNSSPGPGGTTCTGINPRINVTTKDKFLLFMLEKLFYIGKRLPVVITPTYVSRSSYISQSGNGTDVVPFTTNAPDGPPITNVNTRTVQINSVAVTLPFLATPRMFGTFTIAPSWLTHNNGINATGNSAQLYQILYIEYNATRTTKIFFEPQSSRDYLPTDIYPQHLIAYFAGVSQRITKEGFVQFTLNSGGPTNETPYGVSSLTCYALPCSVHGAVPQIGGLKATQLQFQVGIGSPSVIPF
ncbi:MAG: hypothetical protein JOZ38_10285 [Candidatus Eremiobacteraeota bacterium]|nr:hypothetical protein [Candidatus Eremiobacteraeota bacterium]